MFGDWRQQIQTGGFEFENVVAVVRFADGRTGLVFRFVRFLFVPQPAWRVSQVPAELICILTR